MTIVIGIAAVLLMLLGLVLIPFGLPGLWLVIGVAVALALLGWLSLRFALAVAIAGVVAELAELAVLRFFGKAYGGSTRAFWGAVVGGMIGLFVGLPVPLVGPVLTVFLGTFLGAGLVTWLETRSMAHSTRVGWGVVLARTLAVVLKVGTALAVAAAVGVALVL